MNWEYLLDICPKFLHSFLFTEWNVLYQIISGWMMYSHNHCITPGHFINTLKVSFLFYQLPHKKAINVKLIRAMSHFWRYFEISGHLFGLFNIMPMCLSCETCRYKYSHIVERKTTLSISLDFRLGILVLMNHPTLDLIIFIFLCIYSIL